jgi:hypothetical protein
MNNITLPGPLVIACDGIVVAVASQVTVTVQVVSQIDLAFRRFEARLLYDVGPGYDLLASLAASGEGFDWTIRPLREPEGHLLARGPASFDG